MNYIAHFALSGNSEYIKIGNFLGDWVKGNNYLKYPLVDIFYDYFSITAKYGWRIFCYAHFLIVSSGLKFFNVRIIF